MESLDGPEPGARRRQYAGASGFGADCSWICGGSPQVGNQCLSPDQPLDKPDGILLTRIPFLLFRPMTENQIDLNTKPESRTDATQPPDAACLSSTRGRPASPLPKT